MRRNDNIYCMHAKDVCFTPKIQLPGINIEDTIDEWLDNDEDISSFIFSTTLLLYKLDTLLLKQKNLPVLDITVVFPHSYSGDDIGA
jgi:hypothetical protein